MAQLSYTAELTAYSWTGSTYINYTARYDPVANATTVTFETSEFSYYGRSGYGTSASATITVTASDNSDSSGSATLSTYGSTNGGVKSFTGTPSPASITVQHAAGGGAKGINISASSTIKVYPTSWLGSQKTATGSGSASETAGTAYVFHKSVSEGVAQADVYDRTNTRSAKLAEGDLLCAGDVIQLYRAAADGYELTAAHFGGGGIVDDGATHTVTGETTVTVTAKKSAPKGYVKIDTGQALVNYCAMIDTGTGYVRYRAYIDTGTKIVPY
jgi:hypothetical protein|nr:MAG TPA: hypothetical protein [Caudoviricetes sp.]